MWQARALAEATGRTGAVLLSVLAHNYDDAMPVLLRVVFPGFKEPALPCLTSAGRVMRDGTVAADMISKNGRFTKHAAIYASELHLRDDFRKLADRLKLSDEDRMEMFEAIRRWVTCDYRIDPTFNPKDPDAKRLVSH